MEPAWELTERLWKDERGVSAIVLALSLTTVLGFAGLAVDAGLWYADKRTLQGAADLAAWTAAQTYSAEGATAAAATDARNAALAVAAAQGYSNGSSGVTVTVNNPPASGSYKATSSAFEVIITKGESLFFSSPYLKSVKAAARAVGLNTTTTTTTTSSGGGVPGCILQLGNDSTDQVLLDNNAQVNASSCGVYANGTASTAIDAQGSATLTTNYVNVVGGETTGNNGSIKNSGSTVTGASVTADPYSSVTLSAVETYTNTTISCSNYNGTSYSSWSSKPYTPAPGVYCGGLSVSNGNSMSMSPGIYYMVGGDFSVESGSVNSSTGANIATGVTIVLVPANGYNPQVNIGNGATFSLSAPSTGPTAGIAVYGPSTNGTVNFNGGSVITLNGAIYAPLSAFNLNNNTQISTSSQCTQFIARTLHFAGGMHLALNCSNYGTKSITATTTTTTTTNSIGLVE